MDARFRGLFLASAGILFASIGFTLSVLSTFLRLLLPFRPTRGAAVASTIIRRRSTIRTHKHRRSNVSTPNSSSSISSPASTSTSLESCSSLSSRHPSVSEMNGSKSQHLEPTIRANAHNRVVSESAVDERPDFRQTAVRRHRRSDSAPPSPAPWASSHSDDVDASTHTTTVDDTVLHQSGKISFHLPNHRHSLDAATSPEDEHSPKSTGLSFLHRRKVRKAPSASDGSLTAEPLHLAEKKKSQLFAPLLHRRHSQNISDVDPTHRLSLISVSSSVDEHDNAGDAQPSHEKRHSWHDTARVLPKRSQTLRTQPYEAPYFFPTPGSVAAENYVPPRPTRKPVRSKTLSPDEMGVLQ